jgi:hypothetical protein
MSLKSISCACNERPEVCTWYLSFCERSSAPYRSRIAMAQIRRATRPSTVYSASMPLLKKKDRFGAKSSTFMPRARYASTYVKPFASVNASCVMGFAPASAMW